MDRDEALSNIKPKLAAESDSALDPGMATFQFETLRPILKFQNAFFLRLARQKLLPKYPDWQYFDDQKRRELLSSWTTQDLGTKKTIEGSIIAFMTMAELDFYYEHEKEIQKRIRAFVIERIRKGLE